MSTDAMDEAGWSLPDTDESSTNEQVSPEDGGLLVYDPENPDAWRQCDGTAAVDG